VEPLSNPYLATLNQRVGGSSPPGGSCKARRGNELRRAYIVGHNCTKCFGRCAKVSPARSIEQGFEALEHFGNGAGVGRLPAAQFMPQDDELQLLEGFLQVLG